MSRPLSAPPPATLDTGHELAELLALRVMRPTRSPDDANDDRHPNLLVALEDVDGWLDDPRKYEPKYHRPAWESMADDAGQVFDTRGPRLLEATNAITRLRQQLRASGLGADAKRRLLCRQHVSSARTQLAQLEAARAAFDDLVSAAADLDTAYDVLGILVQHLEATIDVSGRRSGPMLLRLNDVLDDRAWDIRISLHELGDLPEPPEPGEIMNQAGLDLGSRLQLCHRLLKSDQVSGHHVVWLIYDNARLRPHTVEFGTVTFFDGKMLVDALKRGHLSIGQHHTAVPAELAPPGELSDWPDWPPKDEDWVAARVDLGDEPVSDPAREAADQADALVKLVAFYGHGTVWRRMAGHQRVFNGTRLGGSIIWGRPDLKLLQDKTDFVLEAIAPNFGPHITNRNSTLKGLIDVAAILDTHRDDLDPVSIVHSVRAIEKIMGRSAASWQDHLKTHFRGEWARDNIRDEIALALHRVAESYELRGLTSLPPDSDLYPEGLDGSSYAHAVAIDALLQLAHQIPAHHPVARRVRTIARRCANSGELHSWAVTLAAEYDRLVDRLSRCRNSLAHGGPVNDAMAKTVQHIADTHARRTTGAALNACLAGEPPASGLEANRVEADNWLALLPSLTNARDAFRQQ